MLPLNFNLWVNTMLKRNLLSVAVLAGLSGCAATQSTEQQVVNTLADNLDVQYEVLTNHGANEGLACQDLGAEWASCNKVNMTLVNQGEAVDSKDWAIYFHSIRLILDVDNEQFKITRVTGDLHKLEPTDQFDGFAAGEEVVLPLVGEYWQLFETDFMPGAFVTAPNAEPKMIASLNTEDVASFVTGLEGNNLKRTPDDNNVMATAVTRFEKNADLVAQDVSTTLLPTPMSVEVVEGNVDIAGGIALPKDAFDAEQFAALEARADVVNLDVSGDLPVSVAVGSYSI